MSHVLIYENEPELRDIYREILEMVGHEVTTSPSLIDALDRLSRDDFHVFIMDLDVASYSTLQLLDICQKAKAYGAHTVIVSGHKELSETFESAGFRFFTKPVGSDDLLAFVDNVT